MQFRMSKSHPRCRQNIGHVFPKFSFRTETHWKWKLGWTWARHGPKNIIMSKNLKLFLILQSVPFFLKRTTFFYFLNDLVFQFRTFSSFIHFVWLHFEGWEKFGNQNNLQNNYICSDLQASASYSYCLKVTGLTPTRSLAIFNYTSYASASSLPVPLIL